MPFASRAKTLAAAAARSLSPCLALATPRHAWFVLERYLDLGTPPLRLQEEWAIVHCDTRNAYGCGEHGHKLLQGLTVYARLVDDDDDDITSSLYIQANDDALRAIKAESGCECDCDLKGPHIVTDESHQFEASAFVQKTDERFIFLLLTLGLTSHCLAGHREREYYLIYDSVDASLLMIPRLPKESECHVDFTVSPLHVPLVGGGGGYEFLLLTSRPVHPTPEQLERYMLLLLASSRCPRRSHWSGAWRMFSACVHRLLSWRRRRRTRGRRGVCCGGASHRNT
ncbi:hypothetical protein U9M48_010756 [Paspalum notatum var. saurae]|uniref:Uncharacterized protein n=1 Tax=Paspalum notatum var. saurae TaxID=547442 RepID=A0AAQ3WGN7_PASNO